MVSLQMLKDAARLWLDPNQRDVAEIRLDDLVNPTGNDPIEEIHFYDGVLRVVQSSGHVLRVGLGK